ncbi:hypothetical protein EFV37_31730 [Mesorhizobium loti]|uniref:Probable acyltransferase, NodA n=1 Tax=Rhizobium loti TaxID=381 RepID=M5ANE3_RHILI|nr:hypothetical protein [Mesorhizobium jarvisii]QKC66316.1 hypothetical protein EB229_31720 [Mesorhizobium jarvisii]QKC73134.1 hypothetical protein EB815_31195 [Mesorhizobium loti]QKD12229.1 hypothetical protein EFV37_31730 [Mesorhizobium loti]BAN09952.1 probable acyltransferase, NodA [Mesorhizobium loti NZP2037]
MVGNDLQVGGHVELSAFFRKAYGRQGLSGGCSWAGAGPKVRAIGSDVHGVAAYLDLLRRFSTVGEVNFLVSERGLSRVHPDLERLGMSHSIRVMRPTPQQLGIAFAFGTARYPLRNHIERLCRDVWRPGCRAFAWPHLIATAPALDVCEQALGFRPLGCSRSALDTTP